MESSSANARNSPPEVVERAVRMVFEAKDRYPSQWSAIESIVGKIGCTAETLRRWVRQAERDQGLREGHGTAEQQRVKALEREVRELRRASEILKLASAFFAQGQHRPPLRTVIEFIDRHRDRFGVEPICKVLQVAPAAVWREAVRRRDPALRPARRQRDAELPPEIERVWRSHFHLYGPDKVWKQLRREGIPVARCTVERWMRTQGWMV